MTWLKRNYRRLILICLVFEVVYLVSINVALQSDKVLAMINRKPEKALISFSTCRSWLPFRVSASNVMVSGKTKNPYSVSAHHVSFWINPLPLVVRKVSVWGLHASGLTIDVKAPRKKKKEKAVTTSKPDKPTPKKNPPEVKKKKSKWNVDIIRGRLDPVTEITINEYRFTGEAGARISFRKKGDILEYPYGKVSFRSGNLARWDVDEQLFERFTLDLSATITPYNFRKTRGKAVLQHLSGSLQLQEVFCHDFSFFNTYIKRTESISIDGGKGTLSGAIIVNNGLLAPGSALEYQGDAIKSRFLDYRLEGSGTTRWRVKLETGKPVWELFLNIETFSLKNIDKSYVFGSNAELKLWGDELVLGRSIRDFQASIVLPRADLPDMRYYNEYIPEAVELSITRGAGKLASSFHILNRDSLGSGHINLETSDCIFAFRDLQLQGRMLVDTSFGQGSLKNRIFHLKPGTISLEDISIRDDEELVAVNWWGTVSIEKGRLLPGSPETVFADFSLRARDLWPLFYIYVHAKDKLPESISRTVSVPLTQGSGKIILGKNRFDLLDLVLTGENLALEATIRRQNKNNVGAIFLFMSRD